MDTEIYPSKKDMGPHVIELADWISSAPFEDLLNISIVDAKEGSATLTMPFLYDYAQGAGLMHGGALVSLADTAMAMALKSLLKPGSRFATVQLETHFLKAVTQGIVTARAWVTGSEGRTYQGSAELYNDDNEEVVTFTATFKLGRETQIKNLTSTTSNDALGPE